MQNDVSNQMKEYINANSKKKIWQKVVIALSCIVVFCTTYALILPAITMTKKPICGFEEHTHGIFCYSKITTPGKLECPFSLHSHTERCFKDGKTVCLYADYVLHEHDKNCYDNEGVLVCKLSEIPEHEHSEDCYKEETRYICGLEESEDHSHTDDCRIVEKKLICDKDDKVFHKHSDDCCPNAVLECGITEVLRHKHDRDCFTEDKTEKILVCTKNEHKHDKALCYPSVSNDEDQNETEHIFEPNETESSEADNFESGTDYSESDTPSDEKEHSEYEGETSKNSTFNDETEASDGEPADSKEKMTEKATESLSDNESTSDTETSSAEVPESKEEGSVSRPEQKQTPTEEEQTEENTLPKIESFEISEGPIFRIVAKIKALKSSVAKSRRISEYASNDSNIKDYVENNDGKFDIKILNPDNTEPEKDADGNYVITAGREYKLTLGVHSPNGILPGTYFYDLPQGITVNSGNGDFIVNNVNIGSWSVDEEGRITMVFNDNANMYTDVVISAMLGISFSGEISPIDFDGEIKVVVKKPDSGNEYTIGKYSDEIIKNASDGKEHIHWIVHIGSGENTSLVGQRITDSVTAKYWDNHRYTDYDKERGVRFKGTAPDGTVYEWTVKGVNGDGLTWGDDGHSWSYVIPERITTADGWNVTVGEGWSFVVDYCTTVTDNIDVGAAIYRNDATIGEKTVRGWASQNRGGIVGTIMKEGVLNNRTIHWTINQTLAGHNEGEKYAIWYFWDYMLIFDGDGKLKENDEKFIGTNPWVTGSVPFNYPENIEVVVTRNGKNYTAVDALKNKPSGTEPCYGYKALPLEDKHGWSFYICLPCKCSENQELCFEKNEAGKCNTADENGWCYCWRESEDVSVMITYDTDATDALENYGGTGDYLKNTMEMYRSNNAVTNGEADVVLPGVFNKELRSDPEKLNGYIASYTITANEAFIDLTDMSHLMVVDTMTETLVYIPGTMVITAENLNGKVRTLEYGVDYTLEYVADKHRINMNIVEPRIEKYTFKYDAQIVIPKGATSVKYSNSASVEMLGRSISRGTGEKYVADINIEAKNYEITVHKVDSSTKNALPGAEFELCMSNGEIIAKGTTDTNGDLSFKTDVAAGIILREHMEYYIRESKAPEGYKADENKHWVVFCDGTDDCEKCFAFKKTYSEIVRVPASRGVTVEMENTTFSYELPATGSVGTLWYTIGGLLLMAVSLLSGYVLRRKKERRFC